MQSSDDSNNQPDTTFVSWISKTTFQEPIVLPNESSFNFSSNVVLEKALEANTEIFKESSFDHILNSTQELINKSNSSQSKKTKFHLRSIGFDPVATFEKSLPKCPKCSCNENYIHCEKSNLFNAKPLHFENSSQESKSEDDVRPIVPKFIAKSKKNIILNKKLPTASSSGIEIEKNMLSYQKPSNDYELVTNENSTNIDVDMTDEDKAHKSQVAKITFKSAREHLLASNPAARRTLGASHKAQAKFVSPMLNAQEKQEVTKPAETVTDDRLKHIDPKMIEIIESEILDKGTPIGWDDIAGLQHAKNVIQEAVVWPLLRPDIFTGLRRPPRGVLLFGPPGTGKTLIGKCVAAQCHATFFSISASSLTSKWIGDGEKMVRALFAVARCHQPAVIFIDEIDSLLSQRSDTEHEASRRIKTEFLVQFDGAATGEEDRLLIVGATNRPHELDEAARRRLVKRLYIPLPDLNARRQIISNLLKTENHDLSPADMADIASMTDGYSGADMKCVCSEAAMGPIRSVPLSQIVTIDRNKVRPVNIQDFKIALQRVRPSVSQDDLGQYVKWNNTYGQGF